MKVDKVFIVGQHQLVPLNEDSTDSALGLCTEPGMLRSEAMIQSRVAHPEALRWVWEADHSPPSNSVPKPCILRFFPRTTDFLVGRLPRTTDFPVGRLPRTTDFPVGRLPRTTDFPVGRLPRTTDFPVGRLPRTTDFPVGRLPRTTDFPVGRLPRTTDFLVGRVAPPRPPARTGRPVVQNASDERRRTLLTRRKSLGNAPSL
jgi:hypothetical protein